MQSADRLIGARELVDVLDSAPVGVLIEDDGGRVVWLNRTLEGLLGLEGRGLVGAPVAELPLEPVPDAEEGVVYRALRPLGSRWLRCMEHRLAESRGVGLRVRYFLDSRGDGRLANPFKRLLGGRPSLDPGTGLQDRRGIMHTLRTEVARSRRYGNPLAVVSLRLEADETVADASGVMARVGGLLKDNMRWADSVGRTGPLELLMVLPETNAWAASHLVRKIEASLAEAGDTAFGEGPRPSVLFGVAEWRRGDDEGSLWGRARSSLGSECAA